MTKRKTARPSVAPPRRDTEPPATIPTIPTGRVKPDETTNAIQILAEEVEELREELQRLRSELEVVRALVKTPRVSATYRGIVGDGD